MTDKYPKWKLAVAFSILGLIYVSLPVILLVIGFLAGFVIQYALLKIAFAEAMRRRGDAQNKQAKKGDAK